MPGDAFLPALARQRNVYFAGPADGIIADGSTSCGAALQALVDLVSGSAGPVSTLTGAAIILPAGDIMLEQTITLKPKVALLGWGDEITRLWPTTHGASGLIKMASGYNASIRLENLGIFGGTIGGDPVGTPRNAGMIGIELIAAGSPGGLSNSLLRNLRVGGFTQAVKLFAGGDFLTPIQSILMDSVQMSIPAGSTGTIFEARGQFESSLLSRCEFFNGTTGASQSAGRAILLGNASDTAWPIGITFDQCKIVGGYQAMECVQNCVKVTFKNGWLENMRRGFQYGAGFCSGEITGNYFGNVAWSADSGEWLLSVGADGEVQYAHNTHACTSGTNVKGFTGSASGVVAWYDNRFHQGVTTEGETLIRRRSINGVYEFVCTGTPEGVFAAPIGSRAWRLDGGASTTLYVKTSGTGNTGWTAK